MSKKYGVIGYESVVGMCIFGTWIYICPNCSREIPNKDFFRKEGCQ